MTDKGLQESLSKDEMEIRVLIDRWAKAVREQKDSRRP